MCVHTAVERSDNLSCWSWFYHVWVRVFPVVCYCAAHVSLTGFPLPFSQECWGVQLYVRHCFYVGSEDLNSGHQANHIRKYNFLFCIILLSIVTVQIQWTLLQQKEFEWLPNACSTKKNKLRFNGFSSSREKGKHQIISKEKQRSYIPQ